MFSAKFIFVLLSVIAVNECSRVLELSDRFIELKKEHKGPWLIKFYAPWCHHCKTLEPVWGQVAQSLHKISINVGRVDCTRFTSVASHFGVSGFPTILFIESDFVLSYRGDRSREGIVDFAHKMIGPAVKEIDTSNTLNEMRNSRKIFFLFVNDGVNSNLKEAYDVAASKFRHLVYFYQFDNSVIDETLDVDISNGSSVIVFKDSIYYKFTPESKEKNLTAALVEWVNRERFSLISKLTHGNLHEIVQTKKFLVIALLEEIHEGKFKEGHKHYLQKFESHCLKNQKQYKQNFVFGWIGEPDLSTSITMLHLPLPNIMILNTSTHQYHLISDTGIDHKKVNVKEFNIFLESVINQSVPSYGGTGLGSRLYRMYFDTVSTFVMMWTGSPILTILLFGVPLAFLTLICYSTFCSDIMDSNEEDEDEEDADHEKRE